MKVIIDQNVPRNLVSHLIDHDVTRSIELGWENLRNVDLLSAAEGHGFEVFITADRNIAYQQNVRRRKLSIVVLPAGNWPALESCLSDIVRAVKEAAPGGYHDLRLTRGR